MKTFAITFSQTSKGEDPQQKPFLALKYYDIPENKYEKMFLSAFLENYSTSNSEELEIATKEAHKFFIEHQEEILTEIKVNELIELHEIGKRIRKERKARFRAEMWAPLLSALPGIISNATMAGLNAGQQQQIEYQQKINRDKEIQAFLAQNSSKPSYKEYKQDFGSAQNTNTKSSYRKVTTSNGFDEPLPSAPTSNTPQQNYSSVQSSNNRRVTTSNGFDEPLSSPNSYSTGQGTETVGIMVSNGSQQNVRIKVNGNTIVGIYVGGNVRSPLGEGWTQTNIQGIPTNIQLDGEWSKMYKNRATSRDINNAIIYF